MLEAEAFGRAVQEVPEELPLASLVTEAHTGSEGPLFLALWAVGSIPVCGPWDFLAGDGLSHGCGPGCSATQACLPTLPCPPHLCRSSPTTSPLCAPHSMLYVIASFQSSPRKRWLSTYSVPGPMQGTEDMHPRLK